MPLPVHRSGKAFICLKVLSWIRWREEEALLMNNDLLVVKCSPLGGRPIVLQWELLDVGS